LSALGAGIDAALLGGVEVRLAVFLLRAPVGDAGAAAAAAAVADATAAAICCAREGASGDGGLMLGVDVLLDGVGLGTPCEDRVTRSSEPFL
jgi:hypothetical protein